MNRDEHQETERRLFLGGVQSEACEIFSDLSVKILVQKSLNSSRGVIRYQDLADMLEVEIRDEQKD